MDNNKISIKNDTKKVFWKKGTCSQTYFYILNREFGHLKGDEEKASDPLSGGLMQQGYQCGMLWGASMAVSAEAFRRCNGNEQTINKAVTATQYILESFPKTAKCVNCREITKCNLASPLGMAKLLFKTILSGFVHSKCFNLSKKWATKAIEAAKDGLSQEVNDSKQAQVSCASELIKKMGGNEEQTAMVSGLAGGMGLSGNACGALGAAIWFKTLEDNNERTGRAPLYSPKAKKALKIFLRETDSKILCSDLCGRNFKDINEHTEFIKNGGCEKIINILTEA